MRVILLASVVVGCYALPVAAQTNAADVLRNSAASGWTVRAITMQHDTLMGTPRQVRTDVFLMNGATHRVDALLSIERGRTMGSGILAGAIAGGITVAILARAIPCDDEYDGCNRTALYTGGSVVLGLALGAVSGHIVAPGHRAWETIWPH